MPFAADVIPNDQLSDLVDFALGYPEVGVVNFNALHQLLHIIVSKLNSGANNEVKLLDNPPAKSPAQKAKLDQLWQKFTQPPPTQVTHIDSRDSFFAKKESKVAQPSFKQEYKFMQLQQRLDGIEEDLRSLINPKLPAMEKLSDMLKTDTPIADMWHLIALTKKAEANEAGVQTAMGLIQQTFKELKTVAEDLERVNAKVEEEQKAVDENKQDIEILHSRVDYTNVEVEQIGELQEKVEHVLDFMALPKMEPSQPEQHVREEEDEEEDKQNAGPTDSVQTKAKSEPQIASSVPPTALQTPRRYSSDGTIVQQRAMAVAEEVAADLQAGNTPDTVTQPTKQARDQPDGNSTATPKIPNLWDLMKKIDSMEVTMNAMPTTGEFVTWPVLEGALNGVRKSQAQQQPKPQRPIQRLRTFVSTDHPSSLTDMPTKEAPVTVASVAESPSEDIFDVLENLGTVNRRFCELSDEVKDIASELSRKADITAAPLPRFKSPALTDDMRAQLSSLDDLSKQVKSIADAVEEISYLKKYLQSLEVLLADIPEASDNNPPKLGDKSRSSSVAFSSVGLAVDEPTCRLLSDLHATSELEQRKIHQSTGTQDSRRDHTSSITNVTVQKISRKGYSKSDNKQTTDAGTGHSENLIAGESTTVEGSKGQHGITDHPKPTPKHHRDQNKHKKSSLEDTEQDKAYVKAHTTGSAKSRSSSKQKQDDKACRDMKSDSDKDVHMLPRQRHGKVSDQSRDKSRGHSRDQGREHSTDQGRDYSRDHSADDAPRKSGTRLGSDHPTGPTPPRWSHSRKHDKRGSKENLYSHTADGRGRSVDDDKRRQHTPSHRTKSDGKRQPDRPDSNPHISGRAAKPNSRLNVPGHLVPKQPSRTRRASEADDEQDGYASGRQTPNHSPEDTDENVQRQTVNESKLRQLYDQKRAVKEMLLSDRELLSHEGSHSPYSVESATSVYYPVEPLRSQTISPDNLRSTRFNSTLREIISSDYMIEIKKLQRRIDKLELKLSYSLDRDSTPVIQYIGGLDDDRIDRILQRMDSMKTEINRKLRDMDEELYTVLEHGVGDGEAMLRTQVAMGDLQSQLEALRTVTQELQEENEQKTIALQRLADEAEKLNEDKIGRASLKTELNLKANLAEMDLKINTAEFEALYNDLQILIDDLVDKLVALESAWKNAHGKLEDDLALKEDTENIEKLRRSIDRKMKELNQKLKQQQALLNPTADNAGGLRRKLPFNCLSCDKPVAGLQYGPFSAYGDCFSPTRAGQTLAHYSASDLEQIRNHAKSEHAKTCGTMSQLRNSNMKAYMVHFGKENRPKVFITRSKARMEAPGCADLYSNPRACGGKHTVTQNKTQGPTVTSGKNMSLKNLLDNEEFVAAGNLKREESIIHGADGKPYKSRADVIDIDEELTEALLVTRDPIMPLVDEMKQSRSRSAATTSNEPKFNSQSGSISSRDSRLHGSHIVHDKTASSEHLGMSRQRNNTPQSSTIHESDDIGKPST